MAWGYSTPKMPFYFFPHTFDENYIYGARNDQNEFWVTTNGGTTWTKRTPSITGRGSLAGIKYFSYVLADERIYYLLGHDASGNVYVAKTTNLGTAFTDVSNFGAAGYLDTVLGSSNYAHKVMLLDYFKV